MFAWQATVQDEKGNAVPSPIVAVYNSDGATLADIYDESGAVLENPFTGTAEGFVQFWALSGEYVVDGTKGTTLTEKWFVSLGDEFIVKDSAEFFSRNKLKVGYRYSSQNGLAWDIVAAGAGDFNHPIAGDGVRVVPNGAGEVSILAFGAVEGDQVAASKNVTAIRTALLASATRGFAWEVPLNEFYVNDNFTITFLNNNSLGIMKGRLRYADVLNPDNLLAQWMFVFDSPVTPIRNFEIRGMNLDGNKANVKKAGVTPATSFGVWVTGQCKLEDTVVIRDAHFSNFVTSGYNFLNGPFHLINPISVDNTFHGIAFQEATGKKFDGYVNIVNPITLRNGGLGIDFSGGKAIVTNSTSLYNKSGAAKASVGMEEMIVRGANWSKSTGNAGTPTSGFGFYTTGVASDFINSIIDVDGLIIEDNNSIGFNVSEFGGIIRIGSIRASRNDPAKVSAESSDIAINAPVVLADHLESNGSTGNGVGIGPLCRKYDIGRIVSRRAQRSGFRRGADGVLSSGAVRSGVMESNNQSGVVGADGCAIRVARGSLDISGVAFLDADSVPTQTGGVYASGGSQVHIDACDFGSGIAPTGHVYTATAGTRVTFGENKGIVTRYRGQFSANGGGTNVTYTLPSSMTALGGAAFVGYAIPRSADAMGSYRVGLGASFVQAIYAANTPAGTNNVTLGYDIEMVLQR